MNSVRFVFSFGIDIPVPKAYALYINGNLLGNVEAKPEKTGVPGILGQDERYSKRILRKPILNLPCYQMTI